jgi:uncharacterized protein involved in oxidation of intracellular sulfur
MHQLANAVHKHAQLCQLAELLLAHHLCALSHSAAPGEMPAINVMLTLPDSETREISNIRAFIRTGVNMQKIVIVANGAAYGSESLFNSLRLAIALREKESDLALRLFLMSDAVTAGLKGQKPAEGYNIQQMLEILTAQNVPVKLCKTCTDGRGITGLPLIDGVEIGTLVELAEWTLSADKVLTF